MRGRHFARAFRFPHRSHTASQIRSRAMRDASRASSAGGPGHCRRAAPPATRAHPPPPEPPRRTPSHPQASPRRAHWTNDRPWSFLHLHCCDIEIQFSGEPRPELSSGIISYETAGRGNRSFRQNLTKLKRYPVEYYWWWHVTLSFFPIQYNFEGRKLSHLFTTPFSLKLI